MISSGKVNTASITPGINLPWRIITASSRIPWPEYTLQMINKNILSLYVLWFTAYIKPQFTIMSNDGRCIAAGIPSITIIHFVLPITCFMADSIDKALCCSYCVQEQGFTIDKALCCSYCVQGIHDRQSFMLIVLYVGTGIHGAMLEMV